MKKYYQYRPNLFLIRTDYFYDAVIGRLLDEKGNTVCLTLEPPPSDGASKWKRNGRTSVPEGVFRLVYEFDEYLRYGCLRLCGRMKSRNVRICFITKRGVWPGQTRHDILVGMELKPEEGIIGDALAAFRRLKEYYETKRCEQQKLFLSVRDAPEVRLHRECFARQEEAYSEECDELEDFELQTC